MRARLCIIAAGHLAGALINGPAVYAGPPPDAAAELRALEQKWVDAQIRRDAAAVAELLEDQFHVRCRATKPIGQQAGRR